VLLLVILLTVALLSHKISSVNAPPSSSDGNKIATPTDSKSPIDALNKEISLLELKIAKASLIKAKSHNLAPLRNIDKSKYTVRINTWRRNEQLIASVKHFSTCPGVAQIQVVWCDSENSPPAELLNLVNNKNNNNDKLKDDFPAIVIEQHSLNSLNERFNVLTTDTPTYGILSIDDDVLRPCEALDDGFFRWTDHPDRIVGYDTRTHIVNNKNHQQQDNKNNSNNLTSSTSILDSNPKWTYGYLSSARKLNQYSIVLPRFCFLHIDYLSLYMTYLPQRIMQTIETYFNCEDIAMSFFISALTNGQVPLLPNQWSMLTMVKMKAPKAISQKDDHKSMRDKCTNDFGFLLGLMDGYKALIGNDSLSDNDKQEEQTMYTWNTLKSKSIWKGKRTIPFGVGIDIDMDPLDTQNNFVGRRKELVDELKQWIDGSGSFWQLQSELTNNVRKMGLLLEDNKDYKII